MRTVARRFLVALVMLLPVGVAASPTTLGFDGSLDYVFCSLRPGCYADFGVDDHGNTTFSGRMTFDTSAPDLDPDPDVGRYEYSGGGTGLSFTVGNLTFFTTDFQVHVLNDQFGPWCDNAVRRDYVSIVSVLGHAIFDSCDLGALTSDANLQAANLALLDRYSTGFGEGAVLHLDAGADFFSELLGNTRRIYRVAEPPPIALVGIGLLVMAMARGRRRAHA